MFVMRLLLKANLHHIFRFRAVSQEVIMNDYFSVMKHNCL